MAKNVIITEDGYSKTISNATRIRTALEGGGTCDWIPKEDVPLQELVVTEDGVYNPEESYYGFSQVAANGVGTVVEGTLIEKTVTKNGTYNITDESGNPYGYSKITVNVDTSNDDSGGGSGGGSNPVVGKDEDGNDTMVEADDDGNIVMTALPTEIKVIIPPTKLEYNRYEEIDYSGISVYAYISKAVHWLGTTTTAVSEGSSNNTVSIGGNNVTVSIGDGVLYAPDRTGANDIQLIWDGTKWVKPGNYSAEKAVWKSDEYTTGKIPFDELIFPVLRANEDDIGENTKTYKTNANLDTSVLVTDNGEYRYSLDFLIPGDELWSRENNLIISERINAEINTKASMATFLPRLSSDIAVLIIASDSETESVHINEQGDELVHYAYGYGTTPYRGAERLYNVSSSFSIMSDFVIAATSAEERLFDPNGSKSSIITLSNYHTVFSSMEHRYSYSHNGKTVYYTMNGIKRFYYTDPQTSRSNEWSVLFDIDNDFIIRDNNMANAVAWTMVYGLEEKNVRQFPITLPVQWKRPGDGKILETTFTAWMTDDGDNNTSGNTTPGNQNIDVPQ